MSTRDNKHAMQVLTQTSIAPLPRPETDPDAYARRQATKRAREAERAALTARKHHVRETDWTRYAHHFPSSDASTYTQFVLAASAAADPVAAGLKAAAPVAPLPTFHTPAPPLSLWIEETQPAAVPAPAPAVAPVSDHVIFATDRVRRGAEAYVAALATLAGPTLGDACRHLEASLAQENAGVHQKWCTEYDHNGIWSPLANQVPYVLLQAVFNVDGTATPLADLATHLVADPSLVPRIGADDNPLYTTGATPDRPPGPTESHRIWYNMKLQNERMGGVCRKIEVRRTNTGETVPGCHTIYSLHNAGTTPRKMDVVRSMYYNEKRKLGVALYGSKDVFHQYHRLEADCSQTLYLWSTQAKCGTHPATGALTFRMLETADGALVFLVELAAVKPRFRGCGLFYQLEEVMLEFAPPDFAGPIHIVTAAQSFAWHRLAGLRDEAELRALQPEAATFFANISMLDPLFTVDEPTHTFEDGKLVDKGGDAADAIDGRVPHGSYYLKKTVRTGAGAVRGAQA